MRVFGFIRLMGGPFACCFRLIVTPSGAASVQSFTITTANDAEGRDPTSWRLYGTNDAISSADNSTGLAENWALIGSGSVSLPASRYTTGPVVPVSNSTAYSSYRMLYPTLKWDPLMQIADVAFYASSNGSGANILGASDPILAIQELPASEYPGHEGPANVIDTTLGKYLNFGEENSGFIVTPAFGSSASHPFFSQGVPAIRGRFSPSPREGARSNDYFGHNGVEKGRVTVILVFLAFFGLS